MTAAGDDLAGRTFGNYRIVQEIGRGGMGVVYEAIHDAIGRRAAIKVLRPHLARNPEVIERFFREARAVNQVRHPSLVQIFDMGRAPDGTVYAIMELLEGESLAQRLRRTGPMAPTDAMRCFGECADALAAVHAQGIAHRDLKPDNIFLSLQPNGTERAVLLDFGVAKLLDPAPGVPATLSGGGIVGTPMYMAPEQCAGRADVDTRADIYSMGCVLYDMLTGAPPFVAPNLPELMLRHAREAPPLLRSRRPDLPPALDDAVQIAMAKDPSQRFASIVAFTAALRSAAGPYGVAMPTVRPLPIVGRTSSGGGVPRLASVGGMGGSTGGARAIVTTGASAASEMVAREAVETRVPGADAGNGRVSGGSRGGRRGLVVATVGAAVAFAAVLGWRAWSGGGAAVTKPVLVPDAATIVLREDPPPRGLDAGRAAASDAGAAQAVALATESDCRAAVDHAASLLGGDLPDAARAWRRLADPARRDEMVASCVAQFDLEAATCFQGASDALAVAACGDRLVLRRCARGLADACADASQIHLAAGRFDDAFRLGRSACGAGAGRGCATLGNAWSYGRGTSVDLAEAVAAYERGAAVDDPESQAGLAHLLRYGLGAPADLARARELFGAACKQDPAHWACAGLAEMELAGLGGRQTRTGARAHLEPACRADVPEACMRLGDVSHGAEQAPLYQRAARVWRLEAGRKPLAALHLGELLRDGKGGAVDATAAQQLFSGACDAHEPLACAALGSLRLSGLLGAPDVAAARAAFERACASGLAEGCEAFHCEERLDPAAKVPEGTPGLAECKRRGWLGATRAGRPDPIFHPAPTASPPRMRQPDNDSDL